MTIYNSSPTGIENIYFQNNGTSSSGDLYVYGTSANPTIKHVTMDESFYGLKVGYYADATFDSSYVTDDTEGHRVWLQGWYGLDIKDRHNDIFDTSLQRFALYMGAGTSLEVEGNYWGSSEPDSSKIFYPLGNISSWRDYDTSDNNNGAPGHTAKMVSRAVTNNPFIEAQEFEKKQAWDYALDRYTNIVTTSDKLWQKRKAIKSMIRVCDRSNQDYGDIRKIIEHELQTAETWYKASLDYLMCELLIREGTYKEAVSAFSDKAYEYSDSPMEVEMLARIANIYGDYIGDTVQAKEFADRAALVNPGQGAVMSAYASAGIDYNPLDYVDKLFDENGKGMPLIGSEPGIEEEPDEETNTIEEFVTLETNPFNPSTSIIFSIKEPSQVKLDVFSITGQKVATLANGYMSAGIHTAKFDGSRLASGVYFYRFESENFNSKGKMLLVK